MGINVGLIGLGHWGKNHLTALKKLQQTNKVGEIILSDSRKEYGLQIAKEHHLSFEPDLNALISNPDIEAFHIVTPTDTHFSIGNRALAAGKHVLIEKPLAKTARECDILIKTAKQNSSILMVGHLFRFHPAIRKLRELISEDYFGSIYSIDIIRKAMRAPRDDSGVLHSLAIHDVDLACYIFNHPVPNSLYAVGQSYYQEYPDESSIIMMTFPDSGFAKIESTWLNPAPKSIRTLELIGSRRSAFIDFLKPEELTINQSHIEMQHGIPEHFQGQSEIMSTYPGMPLDIEISHFIDCVISGEEPLTPGSVGRRAVEMIEIAFKSINTGKVQKITG
jgi:UDP-N-acetylglucosamine 3-dehydrogenase